MMDLVRQNLALLFPIVVLWLVPLILALRDLSSRRAEEVTGGSKLLWGLVIVFIGTFGPLIYFAFGRKRE